MVYVNQFKYQLHLMLRSVLHPNYKLLLYQLQLKYDFHHSLHLRFLSPAIIQPTLVSICFKLVGLLYLVDHIYCFRLYIQNLNLLQTLYAQTHMIFSLLWFHKYKT